MPTPQQKLEKLKELLKMIDESLSRKEFIEAFKNVIDFIKKTENSLTEKTNSSLNELKALSNNLYDNLNNSNTQEIKIAVEELRGKIDYALKEQEIGMNFIRDKVRKIKEGKDGKDADESKIIEKVLASIKLPELEKIELDTPEKIKEKLEQLEGDNRLEIKAIKDLEEILEELKKERATVLRGGGFNKMAMDIHIADPYSPDGAINGVNTDFVLIKNPNPTTSLRVYRNGLKQQLTTDYTLSGKTITFLEAPEVGEIIETEHRI